MNKLLRIFVMQSALALAAACDGQQPPSQPEAPPTGSLPKATADASSIYSSSYQAEFAVDRDRNTRWCSSRPYGKREWLQVDLGHTQTIGRVEILWEVAYARGYQLSTSNDAKDWEVVFRTGKGNGERDVINGMKASGRYLRLECLERGTEHGFSIWELNLFPQETAGPDALQDVVPADFTYEPPLETARRITWHNMPDDRRVQITWMRGGQYPGMPFNQQMTIPVELTLHAADEGPRLRMNPIRELESLRRETHTWTDFVLRRTADSTVRSPLPRAAGTAEERVRGNELSSVTGLTVSENLLDIIRGKLLDLEVEFQPSAGTPVVFDLRGHKVVYDAQTRTLSSGQLRTPMEPQNGTIHLRMLLDRTSIEVFGNQGRVYLPLCILPDDNNPSLNVSGTHGGVKVECLHVHELKSAWEQ